MKGTTVLKSIGALVDAFDEAIAEVKLRIKADEAEVVRLEGLRETTLNGSEPRKRKSKPGFSPTGLENLAKIRDILQKHGRVTTAQIRDEVLTSDVGRYLDHLAENGEARNTGERGVTPGRRVARTSPIWEWTGEGAGSETDKPEASAEPEAKPAAPRARRRRGRRAARRPSADIAKAVDDYISTHSRFTKGHIVVATGLANSTVDYKVRSLEREGRIELTGQQVKGPAGQRMVPEYKRVSAADRLPPPEAGPAAAAPPVEPRRERVFRPGEPPREGRLAS